MNALIAVLPGDGVGPEVTAEAVRALEMATRESGHTLTFTEALIGGVAIDACGTPLPAETLALCRRADAVLLGAVGGRSPQADSPRPEQALLGLRQALGTFANLRPVRVLPALLYATPLRPERVEGADMLFVRELTGGIYFGKKTRSALRRGGERATDLCAYTTAEVERVVRTAAVLSLQRRSKLTSIDKANVLETSRLWRDVATRVVRDEFPAVRLEHVLVDAFAMHLLQRPADFDVIVTENMFGDILTDEAAVLAGSIGVLPSASLRLDASGRVRAGIYEPIHGSAPDIAGRNLANPVGAILSGAMLLRHSLGLSREAAAIEAAVERTLDRGLRTSDLAEPGSALGTREFGEAVSEAIGAYAGHEARARASLPASVTSTSTA
jgi:3-isopropylmalate dehydrogenase